MSKLQKTDSKLEIQKEKSKTKLTKKNDKKKKARKNKKNKKLSPKKKMKIPLLVEKGFDDVKDSELKITTIVDTPIDEQQPIINSSEKEGKKRRFFF